MDPYCFGRRNPPPWRNRNGGPKQRLGGPSLKEREGKGSEWRSASGRRQLQTRTQDHGFLPNPPPPVVNGRLLREQRCFCWGGRACCLGWLLHLVGGALLLRWRCTCLMRPPQATASLFAEIFSRFDATYQFTFQRPHGTVTAFSATGQLLLQHSFTEDELQLHSLRRCLSDPPPAPRPSCPCSVPSQRLVPATPLHGPLPTPCPDSGWSSPCKPRCITTLWSIQWGSLYDDMRRGAFSVPIPCPSVVKRYGVLHPYPLPSLWRSSPGQIRNFPVDATAS